MHFPYEWVPYVVEVQVLRVGQLVILCVPGELTTMAGRRLRRAVAATVREAWGEGLHIVIAGLTNTYSSYVTTYEEYQVQRYEGEFRASVQCSCQVAVWRRRALVWQLCWQKFALHSAARVDAVHTPSWCLSLAQAVSRCLGPTPWTPTSRRLCGWRRRWQRGRPPTPARRRRIS